MKSNTSKEKFPVYDICSLSQDNMRVARTGWLAFFVRYDKNWWVNPPKPLERTNKDQENNW